MDGSKFSCFRFACADFSNGRARITVPPYFARSKGRRTTGSEFSAPSPPAASSLQPGFEWIFLAFPLAVGVTRLRLKYLLVDLATTGHPLLPLLLPFALTSASLAISRASKNSAAREREKKKKKFYVTFPSRSPTSLRCSVLFISTDLEANFSALSPSFPSRCLFSLRGGIFWLNGEWMTMGRETRNNRSTGRFVPCHERKD